MLDQPSRVHALATGDNLGPRAGDGYKGAPTRDVLLGGRAHDQRRPFASAIMKAAGLRSMLTRHRMIIMMLGQLHRRRFGQEITVIWRKLNRLLKIRGPH